MNEFIISKNDFFDAIDAKNWTIVKGIISQAKDKLKHGWKVVISQEHKEPSPKETTTNIIYKEFSTKEEFNKWLKILYQNYPALI